VPRFSIANSSIVFGAFSAERTPAAKKAAPAKKKTAT